MQERVEAEDTLLLHVCCAPCASYPLKELSPGRQIYIDFYNPNILSEEEFNKRYEELKRYIKEENLENITLLEPSYNHQEFLECVKGLEDEPERGKRCERCYELRLRHAKERAEALGLKFLTTLTLSPLKPQEKINRIGEALSVDYIPSDFKKRDGYLKSTKLSTLHQLYRQNYCGCEFSKSKR